MDETKCFRAGDRITVISGPESGKHGTVFGRADKLARGGAAGWPDWSVYLDDAASDYDAHAFSSDEISPGPAATTEGQLAMVAWATRKEEA